MEPHQSCVNQPFVDICLRIHAAEASKQAVMAAEGGGGSAASDCSLPQHAHQQILCFLSLTYGNFEEVIPSSSVDFDVSIMQKLSMSLKRELPM